ncbi:MAG: hypothetical protein Q7R97_02365 [Candidatus Daviesbacteria bacterium]|nr:hypothetical protein [Candidatus Daviesbacteria bacterium]
MIIYFAASTSEISQHKDNYKLIEKTIHSLKLDLIENWFIAKLYGKNLYKNPEYAIREEIKLVSKADFVIAEVGVPSFGVGVAIQQALNQKKPVLCLYPNSMDRSQVSDVFLGFYFNLLKLEFYDKYNLKEIISSNLEIGNDKALSKFNFLVSKDIIEYLDWVTEKTKRSKSDFLREEIIRKIINNDQEYLHVKQNKRKKV